MNVPQHPSEARHADLDTLFWRKVLLHAASMLPVAVQRNSMSLWAAIFSARVPQVVRAIEHNLSVIERGSTEFSSLSTKKRAFRTFRNFCQTVADTYRYYGTGELPEHILTHGSNILDEVLRSRRGAIIVTGHLGTWQVGPALLQKQAQFPPLTIVMGEEPNAETQHFEERVRDRAIQVVYSTRSPWLSLELKRRLEAGEWIAMQMDRALHGGVRVPLCGGVTEFARGPALFARTLHVPVIPIFFPRIDDELHVMIEPPLYARRTRDREHDDLELTTRLAQVYELYLRRFPEQWFNFYDVWIDG